MKKEAAAHEADDKKKKEEVEIRNQADAMTYAAEKTMKESGDKVEKSTKEKVEKEIAETKEALKGADPAKIKSQFEKLQQAVYEMSAQIYKAQGGPQPGAQPGAEEKGSPSEAQSAKEGPTIDAEYEVKDEKQ